jgi:menaquinone-dependent protoporphyrinogen oxidase
MSILIAYASKSGAARESAELLAARIPDAKLCDLATDAVDLANYDTVILGSGVRAGRIYKPLRVFMEKNSESLASKKLALFLCNSLADSFMEFVDKNFPPELVNQAVCVTSFGGRMPFRAAKSADWLLIENLDEMVKAVL